MGLEDIAPSLARNQLPLAGRIAHFIRNWEVVTNDAWVLNAVKGYELELSSTPYQCLQPKELTFGEEEMATISMEIEKMKQKGAICLADNDHAGFYSHLFIVPKKDGGHRPIINLKKLNQFVKPQHFKMESINMLKDILKRGDYMTKVDLKDAYFMVPLRGKHHNLTRFTWKGSTFQFNCLPFGLSSAPWVFTKITRPIMTVLRSMGLRTVMYIDDILILAESETQAREHTAALVFLLENLGMVINHPKSQTTPTQIIEFLGFIIDSTTMELKLPGEKIKKIRGEARRLTSQPKTNALALSRLLGKLNHATQAIPPAPLFYRSLQGCLKEALDRGNQEYQPERRLQGRIVMVGGAPPNMERAEPTLPAPLSNDRDGRIHDRLGRVLPGKENRGGVVPNREGVTHQLPGVAWGNPGGEMLCQRTEQPFDPVENRQHNSHIIHKQTGGHSLPATEPTHQGPMALVYEQEHHVESCPPGGKTQHNSRRGVKGDEGQDRLATLSGGLSDDQHTTGATSSGPVCLQALLPASGLCELEPGAMACDAFSLNWTHLNGYANPPWNLIGKVLSQTRAQKTRLVLITPLWKAQPWYPALLNMTTQTPILLPNRRDLFQPTHQSNKPDIYPRLVAWTISGIDTEAKEFQATLQNCYWPHGDKSHPNRMTHCSQSGQAGVVNGVVIPFQEM